MRREESVLREFMAGLSDLERRQTWLELVREAEGLAFGGAPEIRQRLFELEQSTPEDGRREFRWWRDRVIGVNAHLSWLFSGYWLRIDSLLARVGALLSLLLVLEARDTRRVVQKALAADAEAAGKATPRRARRNAADLQPAELAKELAAFYAAMFSYDDSPLRGFWTELLRTRPVAFSPPEPLDLRGLLDTGGEPIARGVSSYLREMAIYLREPARLCRAVRDGSLGEVFHVRDFVLHPLEAQIAFYEALSSLLDESVLYTASPEEGLPDQVVEDLAQVAERPRQYVVPDNAIGRYEEWLYPKGKEFLGRKSYEMDWQPWSDYADEQWEPLTEAERADLHRRMALEDW